MFIARQPIFKGNLDVYGYELLFRSDIQSKSFDGVSSMSATATVIGGLFESGIDSIVEDKYAFVNFDEKFIYSNAIELIDSHRLVVEMLEDVKVDEKLIVRLKDLKKKGYKIALDDFVEEYKEYPLVPIADIIKFDLIETPLEAIKKDVKLALSQNKILLAEKIETKEEFLRAKEMGFHLFQGYFFSKPSITSKTPSKSTSKAQYFRIIKELKKQEVSFDNLAEMIQQDVNLSYRLVRAVSSRAGEDLIHSIKRALTYMGTKEIERWLNVLMLQDVGKEKPRELIKLSLIRTRFAESIALCSGFGKIKDEAAMMGLFSIIDAMLDQTMSEALKDIAISDSILEALIYNRGILYPIYELMLAYEKGDWAQAIEVSRDIKVDASILYQEYIEAIQWANKVLKEII